ncbi:MAG: hypothetical protein JSS62_02195 [Verrucomicrobia bacterium]|nr:hypothetical protein [Verrucomicrobiota bacterium]MBS0645626.1 hypothetical protein [Verrucomicrobiota bacterium]
MASNIPNLFTLRHPSFASADQAPPPASQQDYEAAQRYEEEGAGIDSSGLEKMAALSLHGARMQAAMPGDSLREILHRGMADLHVIARKNEFLLNLIGGNMTCSKAYVVYLCNLYWLHNALEHAQARLLHYYPQIDFVMPCLYRSKRLLEDIQLWSFVNPTAPFFFRSRY